MADFLQINDFPFPVKDNSWTERLEKMDDPERTYTGSLRKGHRARYFEWEGSTPLVTTEEADAYIGLVEGRGEYWSFEVDAISSRGRGPVSGSYVADGTSLEIAADDTAVFLDFDTSAAWCIIYSVKEGAGAWERQALTSAAEEWENGLKGTYGVDNTLQYDPTVSNQFTLNGVNDAGSSVDLEFKDLAFLPYLPTDEMMLIFTTAGATFSELPNVRVRRAQDVEVQFTARGDVRETQTMQAGKAGIWHNDLKEVSFNLFQLPGFTLSGTGEVAPPTFFNNFTDFGDITDAIGANITTVNEQQGGGAWTSDGGVNLKARAVTGMGTVLSMENASGGKLSRTAVLAAAINQPLLHCVTFKRDTGDTTGWIFSYSTSHLARYNNNDLIMDAGGVGTAVGVFTGYDTWYTLCFYFDGASSWVRVNGTQTAVSTSTNNIGTASAPIIGYTTGSAAGFIVNGDYKYYGFASVTDSADAVAKAILFEDFNSARHPVIFP